MFLALAETVASTVALLAEGVDRNFERGLQRLYPLGSPSSRRAWIEIEAPMSPFLKGDKSPSSRRAWIEISLAVKVMVSV